MPSDLDAIKSLQENILYGPAKAANAGRVAISQRLKWAKTAFAFHGLVKLMDASDIMTNIFQHTQLKQLLQTATVLVRLPCSA